MFPTPIDKTTVPVRWLYHFILPIALIVWLLPILAVAFTAVRGSEDLLKGNYWGMPTNWSFINNLTEISTNTPIWKYIRNSFYVVVPTVIGSLILSSFSGFALGVYRFKFNLLVFFIFVGGNFVPFQILMVPVRDLSLQLGVYDTVYGLILFHVAFQTGFCTFFMRNFIRELPYELVEAARIEGATEFQIYWKVVLPLVRPAMAALAVLVFTFIWNDYFWATVLTQGSDAMPVTGGLKSLNGEWISQWNLVSAGSLLAAAPPIIIFFLMQKQFVEGLTLGASKG